MGSDPYLQVPTFALTCVVLVADNNFGWDRHSWDLHAENGPAGYKLCITAQVLFFWAATLNKISLLCFYQRLAGPCTPRWYSWSINGGIVFQILMVLAYFLALLLGCRLVEISLKGVGQGIADSFRQPTESILDPPCHIHIHMHRL